MALRFPASVEDVKRERADSLERLMAPPRRPLVFDVRADRSDPEMVISNIPRTIVFRQRVEYDFGAPTDGALELAVNILNLLVPPAIDTAPKEQGLDGLASAAAIRLAHEFLLEFLVVTGVELHLGASELLDFLLRHGFEVSRAGVRFPTRDKSLPARQSGT